MEVKEQVNNNAMNRNTQIALSHVDVGLQVDLNRSQLVDPLGPYPVCERPVKPFKCRTH